MKRREQSFLLGESGYIKEVKITNIPFASMLTRPCNSGADVKRPTPHLSRRQMIGRWKSTDSGESVRGPVSCGGSQLLRAARPAMGTIFEVVLPASVPGASDLACLALDRIDQLESQLTVYRDDSELSVLNATGHPGPVAVEPGLRRLLARGLNLGRETSGAYDITSGPLSLAWGFTFGPKHIPDATTLENARSRTGYELVRIDEEAGTVSLDRDGMQINLGSIGKGYALDAAAEVVRRYWWPTTALLHGGHSSVYALGAPPMTLAGRWSISLRNPFEPERPLGCFHLRDRAMGTSGAAFQQFEESGRLYGHIIDPRIGEPISDGPASVSVLAPSAADADALSTAFYLIGLDATMNYLTDRPEIGVVFVLDDPGRHPGRVVCVNVPESEFTPDVGTLIPTKADPTRRLRTYQVLRNETPRRPG